MADESDDHREDPRGTDTGAGGYPEEQPGGTDPGAGPGRKGDTDAPESAPDRDSGPETATGNPGAAG